MPLELSFPQEGRLAFFLCVRESDLTSTPLPPPPPLRGRGGEGGEILRQAQDDGLQSAEFLRQTQDDEWWSGADHV